MRGGRKRTQDSTDKADAERSLIPAKTFDNTEP
jgi:hypothetical protein